MVQNSVFLSFIQKVTNVNNKYKVLLTTGHTINADAAHLLITCKLEKLQPGDLEFFLYIFLNN